MRKLPIHFFLLFFVLAGIAALPVVPAAAKSPAPNARTTQNGVVFFRTPDNPYFVLQKGYYLDLTGEEISGTHYKAYYHDNEAGYARLEGCVLKSDVTGGKIKTADGAADTDWYPVAAVELKIDAGLSAEAAPGTFFVPVDKGKTVYYYGSKSGTDGSSWHYVMYESFRGYLPDTAIDAPVFAEHPSLNPPAPPPADPDPPVTEKPQPDYLKWVMICGISVPAVIIVVLLFRPGKKSQPVSRVPSFMEEFDDLDEL